jgi:pSer/pThr/pTyr-binding forkhead associated (FHA) protein
VVSANARTQGLFENPFLLWMTPGVSTGPVLMTQTGTSSDLEKSNTPLAYEVKKSNGNAFNMGITVGRTPNNDIPVDLKSVSRFHAYFRHEGKAWSLVDAESKVGTWVNGVKLVPNKPCPLQERCELKFGGADLLFLAPDSFLEFASKWRG